MVLLGGARMIERHDGGTATAVSTTPQVTTAASAAQTPIVSVCEGLPVSSSSSSPSSTTSMPAKQSSVPTLLLIYSVLEHLKSDDVRADFLSGNIVPIGGDPRPVLLSLDSLKDLLFPAWVRDPMNRKSTIATAASHIERLLNFSFLKFHFQRDMIMFRSFSYAEWMYTLDTIITSEYWCGASDCGVQAAMMDPIANMQQPMRRVAADEPLPSIKIISTQLPRTSEYNFAEPEKQLAFEQIEIDDSSDDSSVVSIDTSCEDILCTSQPQHPREVVAPQVFDSHGKKSLKLFFNQYEHYFHSKYRGTQHECNQELGRFLCGDICEAYNCLGGSRLKYREMKESLLRWYRTQRVGKIHQYREEFEKASLGLGESFTLYCMRLNEIATRAYPHNNRDRFRNLKHHLQQTLPEFFLESIEDREQVKRMTMSGKNVSWEEIMRIAEYHDRKKKEETIILKKNSHSIDKATHSLNCVAMNKPMNLGNKQGCSDLTVLSVPTRCQYCGRRGHREQNCWLKIGACTLCGTMGHQFRECCHYSVGCCSSCSGQHLGKDCPNSRIGWLNGRGNS